MLTVIFHATNNRYERELSFIDRFGKTAQQRFEDFKSSHQTGETGSPTPYTVVETGERGSLFLPNH